MSLMNWIKKSRMSVSTWKNKLFGFEHRKAEINRVEMRQKLKSFVLWHARMDCEIFLFFSIDKEKQHGIIERKFSCKTSDHLLVEICLIQFTHKIQCDMTQKHGPWQTRPKPKKL